MKHTHTVSIVIARVALVLVGMFSTVPCAHADVTLTIDVQPVSAGVILLNPPSGSYPLGTIVTLTPFPAAGFEFSSWTGDLSGSQVPATLTMNSSMTVTAVFTALPPPPVYELEISTSGFGSVSLNPPGGFYDEGTLVIVSAFPFSGFDFSGWLGDLSGSDNPESIVMDSEKQVTAAFVPTPPPSFEIFISAVPTQGGSVILDPPNGPYAQGTSVVLVPAPAPGYLFVSWDGDLTGSVLQQKLLMTRDYGVVARFVFATSVGGDGPQELALLPCAPNPFRLETRLRYSLERRGIVRLSIYDVAGHLVRTLADNVTEPGKYDSVWNGRDSAGRRSAPGMYFVRLEAAGQYHTRKLVRLE